MAYYARISYNSNGWQTPSGAQGKSPNAGNHEHDYGFGFEEWFFNERRFKDKAGTNCHLAYLEPLSEFDPLYQKEDDLILYTLKWNGNSCTRHIVSRLGKDDWRFIDKEKYLELKERNKKEIKLMRKELCDTMPKLFAGIVANRFDQQVDCKDYFGNPSEHHRLWNIEIKRKIKLIEPFENIEPTSGLPEIGILKRNYFKLYEL